MGSFAAMKTTGKIWSSWGADASSCPSIRWRAAVVVPGEGAERRKHPLAGNRTHREGGERLLPPGCASAALSSVPRWWHRPCPCGLPDV